MNAADQRGATVSPGGAAPRTVAVFGGQDLVGDAFLKLPFLRAMRATWPGAHITWLVGDRSVFAGPMASVAAPYLDRVVERCGLGSGRWGELIRPVPRGLGPYDLLLDSQARPLLSVSLWRIPHRRFVAAALATRQAGPHLVDRLLALVEAAHGQAVRWDLSPVAVPEALRAAATAALPDPGGVQGRRYVAIAPGAGGAHKCWPMEHFASLVRMVAARGLVPAVLLGPAEAAARDSLRAAAPEAIFPEEHPAFAALPPGSQPLRVVAIAARCALGVANDAGPGHMIAAAGTPLVSLFGPTPPAKFRPLMPRASRVLRAQDFGGTAVMAAIPVAAVAAAVSDLLAAEAGGTPWTP
jgi:ADP-heptose:LPS heptosyltransferase